MDTHSKQAAERIVALVVRGGEFGLTRAWQLLLEAYAGDLPVAQRAYDMACRVALRRMSEAGPKAVPHNAEADVTVFKAARELMHGNVPAAFRGLRLGVNAGASQPLCWSVAWKLLRSLPRADRMAALCYQPKGLNPREVGRVRSEGFVVLGIERMGTRGKLKLQNVAWGRWFAAG